VIRTIAAASLVLLLPAVAYAGPGDPDRGFGRRGTVTLKATDADAVGGAVKVLTGNRVLAGGSAAGQFVIVKLRASGALDRTFGTGGQVVPALPGTSKDGVKALATFRDGRIVAAGTLTQADGSTHLVALRLLPTGEIDPSFGGGLGYVVTGPAGSELDAMAMDRDGNVFLGGTSGGAPVLAKLLGDGTPDPAFAPAALGLTGRVSGILPRTDGTITYTVAAGPATFTVVRLTPAGAVDPAFSGGVVNVALGPGSAPGIGAAALVNGPGNRTLVAGTDLTDTGTPRGTIIRLNTDGTLDTRFGRRGIARVSRSGRENRLVGLARDRTGRILLTGTAGAPDSIVVRLRAGGARDRKFGNGGLTYPTFGQPPGGAPIFTQLAAVGAAGGHAVLVGSAAGPGNLVRGAGSTTYTGRFALTVSRLQ
jgi:uncharacterized delta-60 repeat protein